MPSDDSIEMTMYINAVRELTADLNNFDSIKNNCAICGGKGHTFADCLELNFDSCKLCEVYLKIRLAANRFRKAINHINEFHGNKYNEDMNLPTSIVSIKSTHCQHDGASCAHFIFCFQY